MIWGSMSGKEPGEMAIIINTQQVYTGVQYTETLDILVTLLIEDNTAKKYSFQKCQTIGLCLAKKTTKDI